MNVRPIPPTDSAGVTRLLRSARCVMFDFDGPLAHLFGRLNAADVAGVLRERVGSWQVGEPDRPRLTGPNDPLRVLIDVADAFRGSEHGHRIAELDKLLTEQESLAAATAIPTTYADNLVRRLAATGRTVAVTTNNSASAAASYLERRQLAGLFHEHIHGRPAADPALMKPNPFCLTEALRAAGARPDQCLMIGDSPQDHAAASAVGITFLGYAKNGRKWGNLAAAGARNIVQSLKIVFDAAADA